MRNAATICACAVALASLDSCGPRAPAHQTGDVGNNITAQAEVAPFDWPASLHAFGAGFPQAGDPCRQVGESAATVDYLDDSRLLVGCPGSADTASIQHLAQGDGTIVGAVDGVTLISVPLDRRTPAPQLPASRDARAPGTPYNATAEIPCTGALGASAGLCHAGVIRRGGRQRRCRDPCSRRTGEPNDLLRPGRKGDRQR